MDRDEAGQGRTSSANGSNSLPRSRHLGLGLAVLLSVSALAALTTALVLEIKAAAFAYIVGESHWSKAQQDAVHYLYLYSHDGEPRHLELAREALLVPLGDRSARLALEQRPVDLEAARDGFLAGGNDPEDIGRLIWMFRWFSNGPFFRDAVAIWREAEQYILRLRVLADEIEAVLARNGPTAATLPALRAEVVEIATILRPMELEFSSTLVAGARWLRSTLLAASAAAFLLLAAVATVVLGRTMRQIRDSESEFRAAFQQALVGMAKLDTEGRFVEVNDALCRILGRDREQLRAMNLHAVVDLDPLAVPDGSDGQGDERFGVPIERETVRGDGSRRWLRWTVSLIGGNQHRPDRMLAVVEDVSEARELVEEISHQASHDALTGLINRREIERRVQHCIQHARNHKTRHALCFLDLDQFKLVNDSCGHAAGDQLLRGLGNELASRLRASDALGRLGGDEFAVILQHTGLDGALQAAEKLRRSIDEFAFHWQQRHLRVTGSVGVVEINERTPDLNWLLAAADTACYMAKDEGRNRVRAYVETDLAVARRRGEMELASELRQILDDRRLHLHGQCIRSTRGDPTARPHYEVLIRPVDTQGAAHSPAAFLAAAERYQLAEHVDRVVIEMVLEQLAAHPNHLQALHRCHINLSAQSIASVEFRAHIDRLLDNSCVPAEKLCFEVTETAMIGNLHQARTFIQDLRDRGSLIALDDFGSGLSSFAYLKSLPVDMLKIDGVFVRDLGDDPIDLAVLGAICQVAQALGVPTIAEWVESTRTLARLPEIGIDYAQGYAIHRPCPLAELLRQQQLPRAAVS